jgi:acyl carrier protein
MNVMATNNVGEKVRHYLSRAVHGRLLGDEEDIFELGLAHSLFLMQIIIFIEREFAVELEPDDLQREDLSSVSRITGLVLNRLAEVRP